MFYGSNGVLTYKPRKKIYESGSQRFCPESFEGWSYRWCFIRKISGVVVYNDYRYSPTTSRHQSDQFHLLITDLKIPRSEIFTVESAFSLTDDRAGAEALRNEIRKQCVINPTEPDFTKARKIAEIFKIKFTWAFVAQVIEAYEIEQCRAYLERAFDYSEQKIKRAIKRLGARELRPFELQEVESERKQDQAEQSNDGALWGYLWAA